MVKFTNNHEISIKILIWGIESSDKTKYVDTLYRMSEEQNIDIKPTGNLIKITLSNGSDLYFDRWIFQSKKHSKVRYHVYTVASHRRFKQLKKKIFKGTDGIIFVVNARMQFLEDNIESLKDLKKISKGDLIKKIPLIVILNLSRKTNENISREDFIEILKKEKLWYELGNKLHIWNPCIYEAYFDKYPNDEFFSCFSKCARRIGLYQIYGNGEAPKPSDLKIENF